MITTTLSPQQAEQALQRTYKAQQRQDAAIRDRAAERLLALIAQKTGKTYTTVQDLRIATSAGPRRVSVSL